MPLIIAEFNGLPPLLVAGIAILFLLVAILHFKLHAFITLLIASVLVGLLSGMPVTEINGSIQKGMGGILGFIATIIGLGSIFGKVLEHSGGTEALARKLIGIFGEKRAPWAMVLTGFIVSIPVFLDAGLIILIPIIYALTRESGKPLLYFGIPLVAGMVVTHGFVPPTPGPIAVAELLGADLGWVIFFGLLVGFPTAIVAGPIFGGWISKRITVGVPALMDEDGDVLKNLEHSNLPSFGMILSLVGLPIILILSSSVTEALINGGVISSSTLTEYIQFIGHPFAALIIATLLAIFFLGVKRGVSHEELMEVCTKALAPAGLIILVTGAGGVFKQVLIDSNAAGQLADVLQGSNLPILFLAYLMAVIIRVTQGSATVAMITSASLLAPLIIEMNLVPSPQDRALWVLAIAAGSSILSHVNDSGFWLVSRYFGLTEKETLQSWTVMTTIISVLGFVLVAACSFVV